MAVFNSNFSRIILLLGLILILSACSNLEIPPLENNGNQQEQPTSTASSAPEIIEPATEEFEPVEVSTPAAETPAPSATFTKEPASIPEDTATSTQETEPIATMPSEPAPLPGSIRTDTAEMVLVKGGVFEMGALAAQLMEECAGFYEQCDESWFTPAEPIHNVQVDSFYMDVYEATNEAYLRFINEVGEIEAACDGQQCIGLVDSQIASDNEGFFIVDEAFLNHPVTGVTWYGAESFCKWRGARLPSEAEWEMAASWDSEANSKTIYPWGDKYDGSAVNSCDVNCDESQAMSEDNDGHAMVAPVASFENGRSPTGTYDMAGNVWEWTYDWYDSDYYRQSPESNPSGPEEGTNKVVRGGSWFDTGNFAASAIRFPAPPSEFGDSIGFRCVLEALPEAVLAQIPETELETAEETSEPTASATVETAVEPSVTPSITPAATPTTVEPTVRPTVEPTVRPTVEATVAAGNSDTSPAPISVNCDLYPGIDNGSTYVVGLCDWLAKIAIKLGVSYADLLTANPQVTDPNIIHAGEVLNIPARNGEIPEPQPSATLNPPFTPVPPRQNLGP